MKLTLTNNKGTWDITGLASTIRWSGDYTQIARTLDLSIVSSPSDTSIPVVDTPLGSGVQLILGTDVLFSGFLISRTKSTEGSLLKLTCFDRGLYLKRNKTMGKYTNQKPEDITRELCEEFTIPVGELVKTDVSLNRNFVTPTTLYDIIATVYTLSSRATGKQYHIGFRGDKLYVTEKGPDDRTLVIQGKSNLIAANVTESVADMVNAVAIHDVDGNLVRSVDNSEWVQLYGRMQEAIKQTTEDDKAAEAAKLLEDGGPTQKITIDNLGNVANVSGGSVVVREPYTGLYGLFYIDSDVHEWKRGQYYNKLVLNYKSMMDEKEVGSLPNVDGGKTSASTGGENSSSSGYTWKYDYYGNERQSEGSGG